MSRWLTVCAAAVASLAALPARADITVGVTLSTTGPLSSLGLPVQASLALWPKTLAGQPLKVVVLDDGSDPSAAVRNARRLVTEQQADVLLGSSGVPAVLSVAQVATETRTVQLALAPAPRPGGAQDWTFALPQPVSLMAQTLARRMVADKVHKVAVLGWNEAYGESWVQAFGPAAQAQGLQIIGTERFAPPDTSVTAQVLKVLASQPEAVLVVAAGTGSVMPQAALRERGFKGPIYHTHGAASPDLIRVGGKLMEGAVLPAGPMLVAEQLPASHPSRPVALAYVQAFEGKHGPGSRTQFGGHAHDALQVLERIVPLALKQAQPGTAAFRQALRQALESEREIALSHGVVNFTPTDHIGFDARGVVVLRIEQGQFRLQP
ncbi:ABC transporter substrate-binding protein [Ideonella sp. TBM-1]|uniref:ABC transporter substrate-binding protein n=1 Tax=Ideonella livida TaxID=2707176 RepID=A0A7C9PHI7_9BURK|nr:ABC transporter substrate-binding protein [Ideonella livida]